MLKTLYIPNGPKNVIPLFPSVDFSTIDRYYIVAEEACGGDVIATTTINELGGECCKDKIRLHFLNYLGSIDAINFKIDQVVHSAKSTYTQKPITYPLAKTDFSLSRFNIKANDELTISNNDYREQDMKWINELIDSPFILMEWIGIQGQPDSYIPVILLDSSIENKKEIERYEYIVQLKIRLSNEKFIIRN